MGEARAEMYCTREKYARSLLVRERSFYPWSHAHWPGIFYTNGHGV